MNVQRYLSVGFLGLLCCNCIPDQTDPPGEQAGASSSNESDGAVVSRDVRNEGLTFKIGDHALAIELADLNGDGHLDLIAGTGGVFESDGPGDLAVYLGHGDATFELHHSCLPGSRPNAITTADWDGNGALDVLVTDRASEHVICLLNPGDGRLVQEMSERIGEYPAAVVAEDFDADGSVDLVVGGNENLAVYLQTPSGTNQDRLGSTCVQNQAIAAGDLNADGWPDVVALNRVHLVSVYLSEGPPSFFLGHMDVYLAGSLPRDVVIGDFNGDDSPDLAVTNSESDDVSVFLNRGDGTFEEDHIYPAGDLPYTLSAADMDNDGNLDLITANHWDHTVAILFNNGDGSFQKPAAFSSNYSPRSMAIGDVDEDGDQDVLVANDEFGTVTILLNRGGGVLSSPAFVDLGIIGRLMAAGDVNGDDRPDFAMVTSYDMTDTPNGAVLFSTGPLAFAEPVSFSAGMRPTFGTVGDVTNDGLLDIVMVQNGNCSERVDSSVDVIANLGDGTFDTPVHYAAGICPRQVALGDLNGDGANDLVSADFQGDEAIVLLNDGVGTLHGGSRTPVKGGPRALALADIDGDGRFDAVVATTGMGITVLFGDGNGKLDDSLTYDEHGFQIEVDTAELEGRATYDAGEFPIDVGAADLDGDGDPEVIVVNELGDSVTVWENVDGVLSHRVDYATSKRPASLALGDIDGDGDLDIGTGSADRYRETTSLLYNDGTGRFAEAVSFTMGFSNILFADLDEDGREELIAGTNGTGSAAVITDDLVQWLQNR